MKGRCWLALLFLAACTAAADEPDAAKAKILSKFLDEMVLLKPGAAKFLKRDAGQRWMGALQDLACDVLVTVVERWHIEAHRSRQTAEHFRCGEALARSRHSWLVPGKIQMPVGDQQIAVLNGHGRRQDDVRIASGVREKVLGHHSEQIFSC